MDFRGKIEGAVGFDIACSIVMIMITEIWISFETKQTRSSISTTLNRQTPKIGFMEIKYRVLVLDRPLMMG